jgi:hypothetical protein
MSKHTQPATTSFLALPAITLDHPLLEKLPEPITFSSGVIYLSVATKTSLLAELANHIWHLEGKPTNSYFLCLQLSPVLAVYFKATSPRAYGCNHVFHLAMTEANRCADHEVYKQALNFVRLCYLKKLRAAIRTTKIQRVVAGDAVGS